MKKTFRMISLILALALCLSACCLGLAEDAAEAPAEEGEMSFYEYMKTMPGMENVDWDAFFEEFNAKKESGVEMTLEDCLPAEAWAAYGAMMDMTGGSAGEGAEEDSGMIVEFKVEGNLVEQTYTMKEQAEEEAAAQIAMFVAANFESEESKANIKTSIEQMAGANIDISKVQMTLRFINADGSVIYEKTYTYADLEDLGAAEEAAE